MTAGQLKPALLAAATFVLFTTFTASAWGSSLEFMGNGVNDIDRVKIRVDEPSDNNPGPPADIGAEDFTIEFWVKPSAANSAGAISCGANYDWINGNIIFDRDRFNQSRTFGISLGAGRAVFGVQNASNTVRTICGSTDLRDGAWHHVVAQRRISDGFLWLYVDGVLEASVDGPDGDISYPDNGVPGNFCSGSCDFSDPFIVIGAEKHDAGAAFPSYFGHVDELRLSNSLRYNANFTPSQQPFVADADTVGLYHFDEGSGDQINDSSNGGLSPGIRRFGGSPAGPVWSADTPFSGGSSGTLQFSALAYSAGESDGNHAVSVTRTGGSSGVVTIDYATADGTAASGSDYGAASGTLNWQDNDTTIRTFAVSIVDDSDDENDETVNLVLSNATGGATIGARSSAILTIIDNDSPQPTPGTLALSSGVYTVSESGTSIEITITRSGGSDGAVMIDYASVDGTATAGDDYTAVAGTLSWNDGDGASKTFTVAIVDDTDDEADETVTLQLSNPGGGAILGSPSVATLTITDDDTPPPPLPPPPPPPEPTSSGGGSSGPLYLSILLVLVFSRRKLITDLSK